MSAVLLSIKISALLLTSQKSEATDDGELKTRVHNYMSSKSILKKSRKTMNEKRICHKVTVGHVSQLTFIQIPAINIKRITEAHDAASKSERTFVTDPDKHETTTSILIQSSSE